MNAIKIIIVEDPQQSNYNTIEGTYNPFKTKYGPIEVIRRL